MIVEFAPAKINLYLHITGRREDGYHLLDSLAAFARVGDEIRLEPAKNFSFEVEGPKASLLQALPSHDNLVVRVLKALAEKTHHPLDFRLTLIKNLPVASGIGGGSSDAAAALRAAALHWGLDPSDPCLMEAALLAGQDAPPCLKGETCYLTNAGVAAGPSLPHSNIVLVNPGEPLATASVYQGYRALERPFSFDARFDAAPETVEELAAMLTSRSNDLTAPALALAPIVAEVLSEMTATRDCLLARMSGSGATCFGLYPTREAARRAARQLLESHPMWWVIHSHLPAQKDRRSHF